MAINAGKILVIRFSSMGDVILTAPLFSVLKNHFIGCSITFLTDTKYVELFSEDKHLSSVRGISKDEEISTFAVSQQNWDLVIDLQNNRRSCRVVNGLRFKKRTCRFDKLHLKRTMLLFTRINLYKADEHVITRYIRSVKELSAKPFAISQVVVQQKDTPKN